mmetsp:Transcript_67927/g.106151  ORF Transcript_67927/g.106151 Transcript_67927/m.106151 type:complete len:173 (-) Transcript_67927:97-615(-)
MPCIVGDVDSYSHSEDEDSDNGVLQRPLRKTPVTNPIPMSKVRFRTKSLDSVVTGFTPYSEQYGMNPDTFCFNADGSVVMMAEISMEKVIQDLMNVQVGHSLECTCRAGVCYRYRPDLDTKIEEDTPLLQCESVRVEEGDQLLVLERNGNWIRDNTGWLPLLLEGQPMFGII